MTDAAATRRIEPDTDTGRTTGSSAAVSIVVPTRNVAANAPALLQRIHHSAVRHCLDCEVIFVDDGSDHLPAVVEREARRYPMRVAVHRRTTAVRGLAGAVVDGIRLARHDVVVVMECDLQHPPERVGDLVRAATDGEGHDLVVASRYVAGGHHDGHSSGIRRLLSRAGGTLGKILFPRQLRAISDPMSGFFAARRSRLDLDALRPSGFKILLEIAARSPRLRVREIPLQFARHAGGESHTGPADGLRFIRQLLRLRLANRAAAFMLVGLSGVLPNLATVYALTQAGAGYLLAAILAVQVAIIWNFIGAELLVWRDRRSERALRRFAWFVAAGETDLLRIPFVYVIVDVLRFRHSVLATVFTIAGAFLLRFSVAEKIVYRRGGAQLAAHARRQDMKLSVIGTGYLGVGHAAAMAALAQEAGVDLDEHEIASGSSGRVPSYEPGRPAPSVAQVRTCRLRSTSSLRVAVEFADLHFVGVGAPQKPREYAANLRKVDAAFTAPGALIRPAHTVVASRRCPASNLPPAPRSRRCWPPSGRSLVRNPEFLRESHAGKDKLVPTGSCSVVDERSAAHAAGVRPDLRPRHAGRGASGPHRGRRRRGPARPHRRPNMLDHPAWRSAGWTIRALGQR